MSPLFMPIAELMLWQSSKAPEDRIEYVICTRGHRLAQWFLAAHLLLAISQALWLRLFDLSLAIAAGLTVAFFVASKLAWRSNWTRVAASIAAQMFTVVHVHAFHEYNHLNGYALSALLVLLIYQDALSLWPGITLIVGMEVLTKIFPLWTGSTPSWPEILSDIAFLAVQTAACLIWARYMGQHHARYRKQRVRIIANAERMTLLASDLEAARFAASDAAKTKARFVANISHELRTPMNGVIGVAGLLLETELDADQRDLAETLKASADQLMTIVDDILDFSKLDVGVQKLELMPFSPRLMLEDMGELLAPRAAAKKLDLTVRISSQLPPILIGDSGRIRQVILNTAGNALKFTEAGYVLIEANWKAVDAHAGRLMLSITDTGIGIAPDRLSSIFEAFTQADSSTSRKHDGAGLGLTIAHKLTKLMEGDLRVESKVGSGSRFYIEVPLRVDPSKPVPGLDPQAQGSKVAILQRPGIVRDVVIEQLAQFGAEATSFGTVASISDMSSGSEFDLILIDDKLLDENLLMLIKERAHGDPMLVRMMVKLDNRSASFRSRIRSLALPIRHVPLAEILRDAVLRPRSRKVTVINEAVKPSPHRSTNLQILVADHLMQGGQSAAVYLGQLGYSCDVAKQLQEASVKWRDKHYDVVLMDDQFPGFAALASLIRRKDKEGKTSVIAMISASDLATQQRCAQAGSTGYLTKPVSKETIEEVLKNHHRSLSEKLSASR